MALITCPDCGKKVSSEANACPDCGYPIKNLRVEENDFSNAKNVSNIDEKKRKNKIVWGIIITILWWPIGIIYWIVYASWKTKLEKLENEKKEKSDMEKILIKNAKIDALASIDPTKPEEAKKKIEIFNKLDNM